MNIELLESRIAPAVLVINPSTATYTDVDGDLVTIKVSTGDLNGAGFSSVNAGVGEQLRQIDLSGGGFDGANLTITVKKAPGGDGLANVGHIESTGHDLGKVTIPGDLGQIDAGNGDPAVPAVKSLSVRSMGRLGTATQGPGGSLQSDIVGALGTLTVKGDLVEAFIFVNDGTDGTIGSVTIGGSLIGGAAADSGEIRSSGKMGAVKISGDVRGGGGSTSGAIVATGDLTSVTVGGSLLGGSASSSGLITSNNGSIGPVKIGGDIHGGSNNGSGAVTATTTIASVTVRGSLIGGSAGDSGEIKCNGNMGAVKIEKDVVGGSSVISGLLECAAGDLTSVTIGGSLIGGAASSSGKIVANVGTIGAVKIGAHLVGGSVTGADSANGTGYIQGQRILSVFVGGSIVAGTDSSSGTLRQSGSIRAADDLGPVVVKGSLVGNATNPVILSARGQAAQTSTDLAIAGVSVGGSVQNALILAGTDVDLNGVNGDAQIGAIKVGGDWIASSVSAGVSAGGDGFGNANDTLIAAGSAIIARIASIQIGGAVFGSVAAGDHFGFVAQQIGSFKSLGFTAALHAGPPPPPLDIIEFPLVTGDVTIREV
jgi:hypothetical protein